MTAQNMERADHQATEVRPEEVLTQRELDILARVRDGQLTCPLCDQPLEGQFLYFQVDEDDYYAGVKLSCECGFVEY